MKRLTLIYLTIFFVLLGQKSNGQIASDSATYWVNQKYVDCINSGKSVSECQEQNNFLILHIDTTLNRLTIDPSIYYSWETLVSEIKQNNQNYYTILPTYGIDSSSVLNIKDNQITISSAKQLMVFTKIKVKRLDNWTQGDLWRQLGVINCKPFLKYSIKPDCGYTNLLLTQYDLSNYISNGRIWISCSDDYHYNELTIKKSDKDYLHFFLEYGNDFIKMYKTHGRDKEEKIDITKLKECQLYFFVID